MILFRDRLKTPSAGYAKTFLRQMEEVLGACVQRGVRIVVNAGGLNPAGLAAELEQLATKLGVRARIAHVEGDDLLPRLAELQAAGVELRHLDKGIPLAALDKQVVTANAYLGAWGIVEALARGADVVICPRVTDAALTLGPAAWKFGWARDDWDRLAAGIVAGHILECGPQCTGGNYSFFREVPDIARIGFPLAEMHADGSFVVTKHPGTGGLVSVGTITAQLLYEIQGVRYLNPGRHDALRLDPARAGGAGSRAGLRDPRRAAAADDEGVHQLPRRLPERDDIRAGGPRHRRQGRDGGADALDAPRRPGALRGDARAARAVRPARPPDQRRGVRVSAGAREGSRRQQGGTRVQQQGRRDGACQLPRLLHHLPAGRRLPLRRLLARAGAVGARRAPRGLRERDDRRAARDAAAGRPRRDRCDARRRARPGGPTERLPLGTICGARSGDKGGNANVGVWARNAVGYAWLEQTLTVEAFKRLVPEAATLEVERHPLPNLWSLNFVVHGLLGDGVAASTRSDAQAKSFGEFLRARLVDIPRKLLAQ
jgi:hypothetical protein